MHAYMYTFVCLCKYISFWITSHSKKWLFSLLFIWLCIFFLHFWGVQMLYRALYELLFTSYLNCPCFLFNLFMIFFPLFVVLNCENNNNKVFQEVLFELFMCFFIFFQTCVPWEIFIMYICIDVLKLNDTGLLYVQ